MDNKIITITITITFSKINSAIKSDMVVRIEAAEFFLTNPIYVLRAFFGNGIGCILGPGI